LPELTLPDLFGQLLQAQIEIMGFDLARSLAWERLTHPDKLSASLSAVLQNGLNLPLSQHRANLQLARSARAMVSASFGEFDVILAPSTTGEAPATLEQTGNPVFGRVWTLLGLPCVHLPFFTGHTGMPVGLQVIGRYGDDRRVLQTAKWLMQRLMPR
jgi:Asp-tRNA(Asn)/Glu-tRNA(Gln) amidotransferase A subunit family amidase